MNIQLTTNPEGNHETSGPFEIVGEIKWLSNFNNVTNVIQSRLVNYSLMIHFMES